jgi:hypothetical protein
MVGRIRRRLFPWWLRGSDEVCPACEAPYSRGAGLRCAVCDRDLCSLCVVVVEGEAFCCECEAATTRGRL